MAVGFSQRAIQEANAAQSRLLQTSAIQARLDAEEKKQEELLKAKNKSTRNMLALVAPAIQGKETWEGIQDFMSPDEYTSMDGYIYRADRLDPTNYTKVGDTWEESGALQDTSMNAVPASKPPAAIESVETVTPKVASGDIPANVAATEEAAAATGSMNVGLTQVMGGLGAGLSLYSMLNDGADVGNVTGLVGGGLALASMNPAWAALGPVGMGIAGTGALASLLFDI